MSDKKCEKCGHCPTCGRSNPVYPVYPYPHPNYWYPYGVWYGGNTTGYSSNGTITWTNT